MNRFPIAVLAFAMVFAAAGCGGNEKAEVPKATVEPPKEPLTILTNMPDDKPKN